MSDGHSVRLRTGLPPGHGQRAKDQTMRTAGVYRERHIGRHRATELQDDRGFDRYPPRTLPPRRGQEAMRQVVPHRKGNAMEKYLINYGRKTGPIRAYAPPPRAACPRGGRRTTNTNRKALGFPQTRLGKKTRCGAKPGKWKRWPGPLQPWKTTVVSAPGKRRRGCGLERFQPW